MQTKNLFNEGPIKANFIVLAKQGLKTFAKLKEKNPLLTPENLVENITVIHIDIPVEYRISSTDFRNYIRENYGTITGDRFALLGVMKYIIKSDLYKKDPDLYVGGAHSSKTDQKPKKSTKTKKSTKNKKSTKMVQRGAVQKNMAQKDIKFSY